MPTNIIEWRKIRAQREQEREGSDGATPASRWGTSGPSRCCCEVHSDQNQRAPGGRWGVFVSLPVYTGFLVLFWPFLFLGSAIGALPRRAKYSGPVFWIYMVCVVAFIVWALS